MLQLITIRNSYDVIARWTNIKLQSQKGLVK